MLYVFLVESGTTLMFDMNFAMESVASLQRAIAQACSIEVHEQVLLISGGTALKPECIVSKYSAGTDTNPIFLFARNHKDCGHGAFDDDKSNSYANLEERVRACESMAVTNQSLFVKFQLAQSLAEISDEELKTCAQLVDTQHLQQQGWAALVANLDDHIKNLKRLFDRFLIESEHYFKARPLYENLLRNFSDIIAKLDHMPLLPIFHPDGAEKNARHTLLTKYASGPNKVLVKLAFKYKDWIDQLSEERLLTLKHEVNKLLNSTLDPKLKEVGGIGERLFKLNEILQEARQYQMDQRKHEENLYSHHNRMSSNCDHLDLKGLNQIHQVHLQLMLENHKRLMEKSCMCKNSKAEMSNNLCTRIAWIASIQSSIYKYENLFVLYLQQLNRLNFHLHLIEQMRIAPEAYVKTLVEIRRRKLFSTNYLKWASTLSQQSSELHQKEVKLRQDFTTSNPCPLFLHDLFPGMSDLPPPFATKCPEPFDVSLPNITQEDLDYLKKVLPEFMPLLEVPPPDIMPQVSLKSVATDSAFGSEVPSQGAVGPSHSSTSLQSGHLFRTETLSSLGAGECTNVIPDALSPTSSPFEDPFLPPTDVESPLKFSKSGKTKKLDDSGLECKKMHLIEAAERDMFSPIAEEQTNIESDGDEFERVDTVPKSYDPFVPAPALADPKQAPKSTKLSKSNTEAPQPEALRVQVDDLQLTPEGFRSPESNVTSHDFQNADYFFDDSMPSSITESTGLSALGKSPHMVKSHHVIIADMQGKLNEKNQALVGMKGSLRMSRSANLMKMHATMSALQNIIQELREKFSSDLCTMRETVLAQRGALNEETSAIMEALASIQFHAEQEKTLAVSAVEDTLRKEQENYVELLKKAYLQLEVESQKVSDAQREIELYHNQIYTLKATIEDMKQEFNYQLQKLESDYKSQHEELKKSMTLEHELECDSIREEANQKVQDKEDEISSLLEELSRIQAQVQMMHDEKEKLTKEREQWAEVIHAQRIVPQSEVAVQVTDNDWPSNIQAVEQMELQESVHMLDEVVVQPAEESHSEPDPIQVALQDEELMIPFYSALYAVYYTVLMKAGPEPSEDTCKRVVQQMQDCVGTMLSKKSNDIPSLVPIEPPRYTVNCKDVEAHSELLFSLLEDAHKTIAEKTQTKTENALLCERLNQAIEVWRKLDSENKNVLRQFISLEEKFNSDRACAEKVNEVLRRELEDNLARYKMEASKLKSLHIAESQASFNEAINKIAREKDQIISNLMKDVASMEKKQDLIKSMVTNCMNNFVLKATARDSEALDRLQSLGEVLTEIKDSIIPGTISISVSEVDIPSSSLLQKVKVLEKDLQKERDKCLKVLDKISRSNHQKLSLLTCDPGDVVLFFYEEKHKNYIAFHFGNTQHFLHTEGLEILELKIPPDNPANSWAIGVVIDKDHCIAKKKPNRYNIEHSSVFCRVRVKSWSKYKEIRQMGQLNLGMGEMRVFRQSPGATGESHSSSQMSASTI